MGVKNDSLVGSDLDSASINSLRLWAVVDMVSGAVKVCDPDRRLVVSALHYLIGLSKVSLQARYSHARFKMVRFDLAESDRV